MAILRYRALFFSSLLGIVCSLTACDKKAIIKFLEDDKDKKTTSQPASTPAPTSNKTPQALEKSEKQLLVKDLIGVWQSEHTFIIMNQVAGKFQLLLDDTFYPVSIGDIDPVNKTINLLFIEKDTGKKIIWTIKKVMASDDKSYHLLITTNKRQRLNLDFVRKIGTDDLNHIEELAAQNKPTATAAATPKTSDNISSNTPAPSEQSDKEKELAQKQVKAKADMDRMRKQVNEMWNTATPDTQAQLQSEQEAWLTHRNKVCAEESQQADADMQEITRMQCITRMGAERLPEMKAFIDSHQ